MPFTAETALEVKPTSLVCKGMMNHYAALCKDAQESPGYHLCEMGRCLSQDFSSVMEPVMAALLVVFVIAWQQQQQQQQQVIAWQQQQQQQAAVAVAVAVAMAVAAVGVAVAVAVVVAVAGGEIVVAVVAVVAVAVSRSAPCFSHGPFRPPKTIGHMVQTLQIVVPLSNPIGGL